MDVNLPCCRVPSFQRGRDQWTQAGQVAASLLPETITRCLVFAAHHCVCSTPEEPVYPCVDNTVGARTHAFIAAPKVTF